MNDDNTAAPGWYEATRVQSPPRARLTFDLDVDVCVIGAGLAGLTVAREVAQRGWSVAVLEAGTVAHAASGRNTGFVLPGFSESIDDMIERIGLDHTKQLWALSEQGLEYVRRTIDDTGMPGVDRTPGWLHVEQTDNADRVNATVERLRWIGADAEMWETERVRAHLVNPRYFNAVHFPKAFHIHPLNYALGLAALAEKAGARIFEQTPALSIDPAGVRKRIVTPSARLRAGRVVLAGNVQLGALMPAIAATLVPVTTFVMVTEPLGPQLHDLVRYRGAVSDSDRADNHYRIVGENRLQWSGRMRAWQAEPRRFARGLVADIKRNYPGLGPVEVAHIWCGTLGRTVHRMPQIGEVEPGVWLASGFGGHGLNTTAMGGELVARGLIDGDQTWRLFAPYELVWAGGKVGSAIAQGLYWGRTPGERVARALSRYRERRRIAKQERLAALAAAMPVLPRPDVPAAEPAVAPVAEAAPAAAIEPAASAVSGAPGAPAEIDASPPPAAGTPVEAPAADQQEQRRNRGKRAKGQKAKNNKNRKMPKSHKAKNTDVEPAEPA